MIRAAVITLIAILTLLVLFAPQRWYFGIHRFTRAHPLVAFVLYGLVWPVAFFCLLLVIVRGHA